jgi:hypothetical protein
MKGMGGTRGTDRLRACTTVYWGGGHRSSQRAVSRMRPPSVPVWPFAPCPPPPPFWAVAVYLRPRADWRVRDGSLRGHAERAQPGAPATARRPSSHPAPTARVVPATHAARQSIAPRSACDRVPQVGGRGKGKGAGLPCLRGRRRRRDLAEGGKNQRQRHGRLARALQRPSIRRRAEKECVCEGETVCVRVCVCVCVSVCVSERGRVPLAHRAGRLQHPVPGV